MGGWEKAWDDIEQSHSPCSQAIQRTEPLGTRKCNLVWQVRTCGGSHTPGASQSPRGCMITDCQPHWQYKFPIAALTNHHVYWLKTALGMNWKKCFFQLTWGQNNFYYFPHLIYCFCLKFYYLFSTFSLSPLKITKFKFVNMRLNQKSVIYWNVPKHLLEVQFKCYIKILSIKLFPLKKKGRGM